MPATISKRTISASLAISFLLLSAVSLSFYFTRGWDAWDYSSLANPLFAVAMGTAALAISVSPQTRIYSFAAWVVAGVIVAVMYPPLFLTIQVYGFEKPIRGIDQVGWLVSLAMFGMGATLTPDDFRRVFKMPRGVIAGFVLQFSVMPLLGWSIANGLGFPPEIGAGIVLVGSSPGGVSSNVVTYLAKGNVALSVTMTACTSLAAPLMTPLMMFLLAGRSISIDYFEMMWNITLTVFAPVIAGLVANGLFRKWNFDRQRTESLLAVVSMVAICFICAIIAAKSHQALLAMGPMLLLAVLIHNLLGYTFGYWGARSAGLNEIDSRTIAIEVGLQNGGLAAQLATNVLKNANAAIAPAIFAPVMNVTGSLLATWWSRRVPISEANDLESPLAATVNPS